MKKLITLTLIVLISIISQSQIDGLKCYKCISRSNHRNESCESSSNQVLDSDCRVRIGSNRGERLESSYCVFLISKKGNEDILIRTCTHLKPSQGCGSSITFNGDSFIGCPQVCSTDYCNGQMGNFGTFGHNGGNLGTFGYYGQLIGSDRPTSLAQQQQQQYPRNPNQNSNQNQRPGYGDNGYGSNNYGPQGQGQGQGYNNQRYPNYNQNQGQNQFGNNGNFGGQNQWQYPGGQNNRTGRGFGGQNNGYPGNGSTMESSGLMMKTIAVLRFLHFVIFESGQLAKRN